MQLVYILWFGLLITPQALALNTCEGQSFGYKIRNVEKPESYLLCLGFMGLKLEQNCNDGFRFSEQLQTCIGKDKSAKEPTESVTPDRPIFFNIFGYFWPSSQSTEVKKPEKSSVKIISESSLLLNSELSEKESEASEEHRSTPSVYTTFDDLGYSSSGDGPTSEEPSVSTVTESIQNTSTENDVIISDGPSSEEPLTENPVIQLSQDIFENSNKHFQDSSIEINISSSEEPTLEISTEENVSSSQEPSFSEVTEPSQQPSSEEPLTENPFIQLSQEIFENSGEHSRDPATEGDISSSEEPSPETSTEENVSSSEEPSSSEVTEPSQQPSSEEPLTENPFIQLSQEIFENSGEHSQDPATEGDISSSEEPSLETSTEENVSSSEEPSPSEVTEPSQQPSSEEPLTENTFIQLSQEIFENSGEHSQDPATEGDISSSEEPSLETSTEENVSSSEPFSSEVTEPWQELPSPSSAEPLPDNVFIQLSQDILVNFDKSSQNDSKESSQDASEMGHDISSLDSLKNVLKDPISLHVTKESPISKEENLILSPLLNKLSPTKSTEEQDSNSQKELGLHVISGHERLTLCSFLPDGTFLRDLRSCSQFFVCANSRIFAGHCPNELYFDIDNRVCNFPSLVECKIDKSDISHPLTEILSLESSAIVESHAKEDVTSNEKASLPSEMILEILPNISNSEPNEESSTEVNIPESSSVSPSETYSTDEDNLITEEPTSSSAPSLDNISTEEFIPSPDEPFYTSSPLPEEPSSRRPEEPSPEKPSTLLPEESSSPPPKEPSPGGKPTRPPKEPSPEEQSTPAPEKPSSPPPKEPSPQEKPTSAPEKSTSIPPKEPSPGEKSTPAPPPKEPSPGGEPTRPPKEPSPEEQSTPAPKKPSSPPPKEPSPREKSTSAPEKSTSIPPKSTPVPKEHSTPSPKEPFPEGKPTPPPKKPSPGRKTTPFPIEQPHEKPPPSDSEEVPRTDCTLLQNGVFLRDRQLCAKFYVCNNGKAIPQHCPNGLYFDIKKKVCNFPSLVDCSNGIEESETDAHHLKVKKGSITPESSIKEPFPLESLSSFAVAEETGSSSQEGTDCTHLENGIYLRDPKLCGKFYVCSNGEAIPQYCPDFLHFDLKKNVCNHPSLVDCSNVTTKSKVPDCGSLPNGAHIRDDQSCSKIYICANGAPIARQCPHGLYFDIIQGYCNIPSLVNCSIKNSIEANSLHSI
ncbi:cell surface glycoprotein 1 [Drosophila tropicalis]|uniref:cell surface glycoprotein 1 n=1 Tax=Drosophila tropicalis TaxID=46794 RepID=UPI0035AC1EEC